VSELSKDDRERLRWFDGILNKFRPKFDALALGCSSNQFDRAREVADFLNQVLEASDQRELSLGKVVAVSSLTDGALVTEEINFLYRLRSFESHGRYRHQARVRSQFENPSVDEIRQVTLKGARQIAEYLGVTSLTDIVEIVL